MSANPKITTSPADGRASKVIGSVGSDSAIRVTAKEPGTDGNDIAIKVVVAGNSTTLSISVASEVITVNSATSGGGAATSTADSIADAINADTAAKALVSASTAVDDSNGTGVVGAVSQVSLAGGQEVFVSEVETDTVITDPNDPKAVQIPPEADATTRNELAVHEGSSPVDKINAGL